MQRLTAISILTLLAVSGPLHAADPLHPVPERNLTGEWSNGDGTKLLELRADRLATFFPLVQGDGGERHFGSFELKQRLWMLTVKDFEHKPQTYVLASHDVNRLNLIDPRGLKTTFYRLGMRFVELDRDRNGMIDAAEVQGTRLALQFADHDRNRDGALSPAEFVGYWQRNPPPVVLQKQ